MPTRTIVHFEIPANDAARLKEFYGQCFGWTFQDSGMPGMQYWLISTGPRGKSVGGGLYKRVGPEDRPRNFIGVEEIDSAIERFKSAGGTELVEKMEVPGQGWSFIGADPEGNAIALWQPSMMVRSTARRTAARKSPGKKRTTRRPPAKRNRGRRRR